MHSSHNDLGESFDLKRVPQKQNFMTETLALVDQPYQLAARRYMKEYILRAIGSHRERSACIVEYVAAMQKFDAIFTDIRQMEGVEDITQIQAAIDVFDDKNGEKSKNLAFIEDEIAQLQRKIAKSHEELFSYLKIITTRIEEQKMDGVKARANQLIENHSFE